MPVYDSCKVVYMFMYIMCWGVYTLKDQCSLFYRCLSLLGKQAFSPKDEYGWHASITIPACLIFRVAPWLHL